MSDFNLIHHELAKLDHLPPWGRSQGDQWDRLSNFIYRVQTLQGLRVLDGQWTFGAEATHVRARSGRLAWIDTHQPGTELGEFRQHELMQPLTDRCQQHDGGNTDRNTQRRQETAHAMRNQRSAGQVEKIPRAHA